ncbi:hypothetical protein HK101_000179 [Irineochytrium annulatum]|nr:hypothetical protein HK101_000179 [Irineochytrium annulatum]
MVTIKLFTTPDLSDEIGRASLERHLINFEQIAAAQDGYGNSRSVLNGYNDSVSYVVAQLRRYTDYTVTIQNFTYPHFESVSPPSLTVGSGGGPVLVPYKDFAPLSNSGSGKLINAPVHAVRSGCTAEDFETLLPGTVALIGSSPDDACSYRVKIANAVKARAGAVLYYSFLPYQGPVQGRCQDRETTPVLGLSHSAALILLQKVAASVGGVPLRVSLETNVHYRTVSTLNVIADTKYGDENKVIVAGSHLDSVPGGPGINDDGSGSAATLEVALSLYRTGLSHKVKNKVRFAWWSAEELGLLGSSHYVDDLAANNPDELKRIALNLNNDMIGSPNGVRFIYNGKEAEDPNLRVASGVLQKLFQGYFDDLKLHHEPTPFDGRSDYGGFLRHGIPAGGLFTGAEKLKTEEQYKIYGGTPGIPYDPCYHMPCDTLDNMKKGLGMDLLDDMASAMGYIIQRLAFEKDLTGLLAGTVPATL